MIQDNLRSAKSELEIALEIARRKYNTTGEGINLIGPLTYLIASLEITIELEEKKIRYNETRALYAKLPSRDVKQEIIDLYDGGRGLSQKTISNRLNLSIWTVRETLLRAQAYMPPKKSRLTEQQKQEIIDLFLSLGLSPTQIGVRLGFPHATVTNILAKAGLRIKSLRREAA